MNVPASALLAVSVILIALGCISPFLPPNRAIGVRFSWTLHDTRVWRATHWFFAADALAAGALGCVLALHGRASLGVLLAVVAFATLPAALFSYLWYRHLNL